MKKYFKIQIEITSTEKGEILIAQLSDILFYAFEQENNLLNAYINEINFDEEKLKEILPANTAFLKTIIEEENWNKQWEHSIGPVIVHDFAAIRPSFHKPVKGVKYELIITPKMSFGTGHHATTYLMIELMETMNFIGKNVIDFGTGTGVLSILAEKCGASKIIAIDFDDWSIRNATENIEANHCQNILLKQQESLSEIKPADILLANINLNILNLESSAIAGLLKPGSLLLVSGFLIPDEQKMQHIFEEKDLVKKQTKQRGDWLAIVFEKR